MDVNRPVIEILCSATNDLYSGLGKIDCSRYSIAILFTFCSSNALERLLFWMSIEYGLFFTYFFGAIRYLILFVQVTLSHFTKFKIIVGMSLPRLC